MKPVIVKLMIFTVLFLGVFVQGIADTVSMNPAVQRIDSILSQSDSIEKMGGGGAFILFDKEQVYLSKAYGDFSLDKVVSIASATKWISAGVIVKLHEDGYFDIHDIVRKYYPEYQDGKGDMTIAQLFSHTGGLYDKPNIQRMYRLPSIDIAVHLIYKLVDQIFSPGTVIHYAGVGMQIGGGIAERTYKKPWGEIFFDTLGDSLEMTSTYYSVSTEGDDIRKRGSIDDAGNPNVAGGIRTNALDYSKFVRMLYNNGIYKGRRILSEESIQILFSDLSRGFAVSKTPFEPYLDTVPKLAYMDTGMGSWLLEKNQQVVFITSPGAWGCMPFIDFEHDIAGVFLPFNTGAPVDPEMESGENPATRLFFETLLPLVSAIKP